MGTTSKHETPEILSPLPREAVKNIAAVAVCVCSKELFLISSLPKQGK
jgi:hypothetical protein